MKSLKTKLIISNVLLAVLVVMLVRVTIAYFTDTKKISNTLTSGNVKIMLSEAAVKKDAAGNLVEDPNKTRIFGVENGTVNDYGMIYPGQTIYKDPTVQNTGSNDAWIAVRVSIIGGDGDVHKVIGYPTYDGIDIERLLKGGLLDERVYFGKWNGIENVCYNERYAMVQVPDRAHGRYDFYFFYLSTFEQGRTEVVFDTLQIPEDWNNEEMLELSGLNIEVVAFGAQTSGMPDCFGAMTKAFPDYFKFD